ncbi:MAG: hypothetical protein WCS27_17145 [Victivallaceae bacterium]
MQQEKNQPNLQAEEIKVNKLELYEKPTVTLSELQSNTALLPAGTTSDGGVYTSS